MRVLLLAILLLPLAQAVTFDDAVGDQRIGYITHYENGEPQWQWIDADDQGWYQNVDVQKVDITETEEDLVFTMRIGSMDVDQPPGAEAGPAFEEFAHIIAFTLGGEEHHVGFVEDIFFDTGIVLAPLSKIDFSILGTLYFPRIFQSSPADTLADGAGWTASLPKSLFRTADLIPLREGMVLEDIRVGALENEFTFSGTTAGCPNAQTDPPGLPFGGGWCYWTVEDLSPDPAGLYEVELTPPGVGHLFLRMEAPIRLSNGLATTYLFEARLHNLEPIEDKVRLQVSDVPDGWEVRLPSTATFTGEAEQTIPIAVTVPFSHQHGASHFMELTAISTTDPTIVLEDGFGVIFADPPQPAGHHDTLWFHGEDPCGEQFNGGRGCPYVFMNAAKDPGDRRFFDSRVVDEYWQSTRFYEPLDPSQAEEPARIDWVVDMSPSLGIGLDFDTSKPARFEVGLKFENDFQADLDAALVLYDFVDDRMTRLAEGSTEAAFTAGTGSIVEFELDVLPDADLLPFQPGRTLVLFVNATDTSGLPWYVQRTDAAMLLDDTELQLPLIDYHEEVDLSGLSFADLQIKRLNHTFKGVNPGNTTLFGFQVDNLGQAKATLDWQIVGSDPFTSWATIQPVVTHVGAGKNGTVVVSVKAPADAVEGDAAELLLVGTSREDPDVQLFGRMTAYVVEDDEIPDESVHVQELVEEAEKQNKASKKSPLPLVLVLAALLLARRR